MKMMTNQDDLETITKQDTDTESLTNLMNELGISMSTSSTYKLLLHNDEVNDMVSIVVALYDVCKLSPEDAMSVMMEAHQKGKAVAKTGSFEEMNAMKQGLNDRKIEATIEQ